MPSVRLHNSVVIQASPCLLSFTPNDLGSLSMASCLSLQISELKFDDLWRSGPLEESTSASAGRVDVKLNSTESVHLSISGDLSISVKMID